jgi:endoglucanase
MTTDKTIDILKQLSEAHGVSGYEDEVRRLIRSRLEPLGAESKTDTMGNLIIRFPAENPDAPVVLLDAHMYEIGLVVTYVESSGFLRFTTVGGWDERVLPAHAVDVKTEDGAIIRGVVGTPPPHILKQEDRIKPFQVEHLFIDVGAQSAEDVAKLGIKVGDSAVPSYPFRQLNENAVMGKALDDRAGCTVLISVLERLFASDAPRPAVNIVALFSTFEEIGGRGAQAAAYDINPDIALVLEGTVAADTPGVPPARNPSKQGSGPAITLMDRTAHLPRKLVRHIESLAAEANVPCQLKTPIFGGTNAARIHMVRAGVPTAVISVPCRYIHGPHAILRLSDLKSTIALATAFVNNSESFLAEPLA